MLAPRTTKHIRLSDLDWKADFCFLPCKFAHFARQPLLDVPGSPQILRLYGLSNLWGWLCVDEGCLQSSAQVLFTDRLGVPYYLLSIV